MSSDILFSTKFIVPRHSSKKNEKVARRRGNSLFIGKSNKAKFAEDWMLRKLAQEYIKLDKTIVCDINAKYLFYFPKHIYYTKQGERSKKLPDTSNLFELVSDCLQKIKIIENDTQICSFDGSRRLVSPDDNYWLEIELTLFKV